MTIKELIQNLIMMEDLDAEVLINADGETYHIDETLHEYDDGHVEITLV